MHSKLIRNLDWISFFQTSLFFEDNKLSDVIVDIVDKGRHLKSLANRFDVPLDKTVVVVDGANDLEMVKTAGFSIGFQPTDIVKEYVDVVLNVDDLRIVYPFIENYLEKKEILMIPGPTKVTEEVIKELEKPIIPHRDSRFKNLFNELTSLVKEVFETKKDVILLTGSSTLGMEAAIANVSDSNDNVLVISNGKFGERFAEIASRYANVIHVKRKWGERINLEEIEKLFREYRIKAVTMVHNETSTGMVNPLKEIGELAKKYGALFIVDVVSSVGGDIIEFDKWNIDIAVLGVQKAIGAPPE